MFIVIFGEPESATAEWKSGPELAAPDMAMDEPRSA
jgi:hypothetical protein